MELTDMLLTYRILPEAEFTRDDQVLPTLGALCSGGLPLVCLSLNGENTGSLTHSAIRTFPDMVIGVMTAEPSLAAASCKNGARFIASRGFSEKLADVCGEYGVLYLPGCITPSEIMKAASYGLSVIMLSPIGVGFGGSHSGNPPFDKALVDYYIAEYPKIRFIVRGALDETLASDYLSNRRLLGAVLPSVTTGSLDEIATASRRIVENFALGTEL